ncbi:MAG: HAMP domain-containing sensor histidine kinase [Bacteroidota bacterium]
MRIVKQVWLIALLMVGVTAPTAQAQDQRLTIAEVRADRDGDTLPDALGDTVTVRGTLQVAAGVLRNAPRNAFIYDGTAAVEIIGLPTDVMLDAGEQIEATGVVQQRNGLACIEHVRLRRLELPSRALQPIQASFDPAQLEAQEGQLVRLSGTVVGMGDVPNGQYVTIGNDRSTVVVFAYKTGLTGITFDPLALGAQVTITGIAGQFDRAAPFDAGYQLYPRSQDDIRVTLLPPGFFLVLVLGVCVTALVSGLWIYLLRKRVQQRVGELQASEERYMRLFDYVTVPIAVHAIENRKPILVEFNGIAEQLFGYSDDMLQGTSWFQLLSVPSMRIAALHFRKLEREKRAEAVFEMRIADGSLHLFEVRSVTFEEGSRELILSVAQDITERTAYEAGLIDARREAERLTQLKSQFLANMSHEIRTPLTGIIGFAEIMTQELEGDPREFATIIQTSGERLLETLNSVLDLSKLDSGQLRTHVRSFNVVAVATDAVEALQALAIKKGIALGLCAETPEIEMLSDPALVTRLLNNLIGNAVKFTTDGNVRVQLRAAHDMLVVEVSDSGIGISQDFLPHVFDEFAQESDGMNRDYEGSGLGLAISKRLVELLHGTIEVESELGRGTTFTLHLPRRVDVPGKALEKTPASR